MRAYDRIKRRPLANTYTVPSSIPIAEQRIETAEQLEKLNAETLAKAQKTIHYGFDSTVSIIGRLNDPVYAAGSPIDAVSYTVRASIVFKLTKISIEISNPIISMGNSIGWRLTVNNGRVPEIYRISETLYPNDYFYGSYGTLARPVKIEPTWIQAGQKVAIQLTLDASFFDHCMVQASLSGLLIKTGSPAVGGV